jgi:L-ascorbate metabolism protein UlaG (beta-lactamase superfamily)
MAEPLLQIHYLGHASFVIRLGGISILTDYGQSNSFGLDSPIHGLGALAPDVVLYSHHDPDHDRGEEFPGATILDGPHLREEVGIGEVVFEPIRTTENSNGDNTSFLIGYDRFTTVFAGDCQGEIEAVDSPAGRERIEALFPRSIDLLLLPIDWTHPIAARAAAFAELLQPRVTIPMHYWSGRARSEFLSQLREGGFVVQELDSPDYSLDRAGEGDARAIVVGLEPAPWPGAPDEPAEPH